MDDARQHSAYRRLEVVANVAHWFFLVVPLLNAVVGLAVLPGVERAMLLYFAPPLLACLFLLADTGRFNATVVRGCRLFLIVVAVAVILGQQTFVLRGLKPQFPGIPVQADRILTFYFIAYFFFLMVVCPAWFIVRKRATKGGRQPHILCVGCCCWLIAVGFFVAECAHKLL